MKKVLIVFGIIFITSLAAVIISLSSVGFRDEFKGDWKTIEMSLEKAGEQMEEKMEYLTYVSSYNTRTLNGNEETILNLKEHQTIKVVSIYDDVYVKHVEDIKEPIVKYEVKESKDKKEYVLKIDDDWDYRSKIVSGAENKDANGKIYVSIPKGNTFKLDVTVGNGNIYFDKIDIK
ncbi:MAG: hypothetical protein N4A47_06055 [Clostridia bacterium]|jgi:hypothetical protein|nr:hypothetical protein [Clostridia bacterium]